MFRSPLFWITWLFALCAPAVWSAEGGAAAPSALRGVIKVARVVGEARVLDTASALESKLGVNSLVLDGQVVETGDKSSVVLVFSNGAVINLGANSRLEISEFRQNPFSEPLRVGRATSEPSTSSTRLLLRRGEITSQVKKLNREAGSSFTVETPVGAAGIRGTAFRLVYLREGRVAQFALSMAEGLIRFAPVRGRSVDVGAGKELRFSATIDPTSGRVLSLPDMGAPTDVSAADAARLQSDLSDALGAAVTVAFTPTNAAASPTGGPTSSVLNVETAQAAPTADDLSDSPLAAPPPVPPAQRTTPGDGM